MRILVVGGAGYIGAHMCKFLSEHGHEPVVCDNLSTGHRAAVRWGSLSETDIGNPEAIDLLLGSIRFDAVMHFAAASLVGESVADPLKYYRSNIANTVNLLDAMRRHGVRRLVFSSTAAVYGEPKANLIDERHPTSPLNPYGRTKRVIEQMLQDCVSAYGFKAVALRYFNAAGADPSGLIGEHHEPETHLIPRLLRRAAGDDLDVRIFGDDYDTIDGTCVRDYIHVNDLADAHLRALQTLDLLPGFQVFNLGNGAGYTVRQVVSAVESVIGRPLGIQVGARRAGDPKALVASSVRAREVLGWSPQWTDLTAIVESAWRWHQKPAY
ncbi:UDP-glucose 4-epimerase GalE [Sinimarinibacterium sp. CAU 1509]|uniref:UDP-glucose 4-epimerase GalE n=1 Tax=Sinimarinibacterium sp. CAU 1509 TaxID=2562283 RepID=UPI0010AB6041|nr:UDP-glucose 4-epimerase GalE [Sinimarinibacterium sp. CAU 1509]TJY61946.1 UDP-glucose 4-epimerase GalE [Sinimarinibacterium sp. CAU 1509]